MSFHELRYFSKLTCHSAELHVHVYIKFPDILTCTVPLIFVHGEIICEASIPAEFGADIRGKLELKSG